MRFEGGKYAKGLATEYMEKEEVSRETQGRREGPKRFNHGIHGTRKQNGWEFRQGSFRNQRRRLGEQPCWIDQLNKEQKRMPGR